MWAAEVVEEYGRRRERSCQGRGRTEHFLWGQRHGNPSELHEGLASSPSVRHKNSVRGFFYYRAARIGRAQR